ncbi:uncharacterized protein LOC131938890 [Physella acuta]|uniref:uncharacterized protein LOC131938890 n=1 Tax=Physella acuta TaxID=109671 RepID=UPI0027DC3302|nr:uncharacterized protein LOC131938890 [Physella acuta]
MANLAVHEKAVHDGSDLAKLFQGTHEVQECQPGEGEPTLAQYKTNCRKNPGHAGFIAVNNFAISHLPSGYHDNDIAQLISCLADLTVKITVNFNSLERPKHLPGNDGVYPGYGMRGRNSLRTGTGRVWRAIKYTELVKTCPCPTCQSSDTPSKVWGEVEVVTSSHVIFDESEAKQSRCRLWYNDDNSPLVTLDGFRVDKWGSGAVDGCRLCCVTHDLKLADKLQEMVNQFDDLRYTLKNKYKNTENKLTVLVSHPHGCSKLISVGHWVHRQGNKASRYTYTNCTCPGSGGATVYRLGCGSSEHSHIGTNSDGLSFCGAHLD